MQIAEMLKIFRIFAGHGSYCFPGLHAWEAASHAICVVAPGNNTVKCKKNKNNKKQMGESKMHIFASDGYIERSFSPYTSPMERFKQKYK